MGTCAPPFSRHRGCFVFAPSQYGDHGLACESHGHSLIVDPWGRVLADGGEGPGVALAEIDPGEIAKARRKIPALQHVRPIAAPELETPEGVPSVAVVS